MFLFVLLACNEINCDCFFGFAEQRTDSTPRVPPHQ